MLVPIILAQNNSNGSSDLSEIIANITYSKVFQGILVILSAYILLQLSEKFNNWLSEKVPSRFRLFVRQSLPIWRATIIFTSIIILVWLFVRVSGSNLFAIAGTISVALGFAFKDYISSIIAGIVALFETPYRVGDRVKIGEHYGEIVSYGLRSIRLQTLTDDIISIPHGKIWTESISNANDGALEAQVVTNFYFPHRVDVDFVAKILYRAAYSSKYTQPKQPIAVVIEDTPWATHFKLKAYPMDARDENRYRSDLLERAKQVFNKYNIPSVRAFPRQDDNSDGQSTDSEAFPDFLS